VVDSDQTIDVLYGAPFKGFVAERKRLAGERKAAGDAAGAKAIAALPRPTVAAWAVNQLWRHDKAGIEALIGAAQRLRAGDHEASAAHRQALDDLRRRAGELLRQDGHAAGEATLRQVTSTLQAIAVAGGFAPDVPGQLTVDRDPPGFEALAGAALPTRKPVPSKASAAVEDRAAIAARAAAREARATEKRRLVAELAAAEQALTRATAARAAAREALSRAESSESAATAEVDVRRAALAALAAE
jgi:hypothetical protein